MGMTYRTIYEVFPLHFYLMVSFPVFQGMLLSSNVAEDQKDLSHTEFSLCVFLCP